MFGLLIRPSITWKKEAKEGNKKKGKKTGGCEDRTHDLLGTLFLTLGVLRSVHEFNFVCKTSPLLDTRGGQSFNGVNEM